MRGFFQGLFPGAKKKPAAKPLRIPSGQAGVGTGKQITIPGTGRAVATPVGRPVAKRQSMTLGRAEPPTGQRTNIPVEHTHEDAFVAGTLTYLTSSWLKAMEYHRGTSSLHVWFLDGFSCEVEDISEAEARAFFTAPSKGGAYWDIVLGAGYVHGQPHTAAKRWH